MAHSRPQLTPEDYLARFTPEIQAIANALRKVFKQALPGVQEAFQPGWGPINYKVSAPRGTAHTGYIGVRDGRVVMGFEFGVLLDDPEGYLQGEGTQVRELRFDSEQDIPRYPIKELLVQAAKFARLPKVERDALMDARRRGAF
jgi:hypothetical protein